MLWNLLRAERNWHVAKLGGRTERFERRKIMEAVRGAWRSAGCDDITVPKLVLPDVIDLLHRTDRKVSKSLTTTDINRVVADVLSGLEGDAVYAESATGVLGAWRAAPMATGTQERRNRPKGTDSRRPRGYRSRSLAAASCTARSGERPCRAWPKFHRKTRVASFGVSCLFHS